jgi:hypothetical protein
MTIQRSRLTFLAGLAAVIAGGGRAPARAEAPPPATVYKSPT